MSKNNFIWLSVVLVAVVGGALLYGASRQAARSSLLNGLAKEEQSAAIGQEHAVTFTKDGYQPQQLTARKGDTVKFVTDGDQFFWPASNIHPTHGIYPEFDPREPVDPKKGWSFRFDKVGTWKYHDHLAPYYTGSISVTQ